MPPLIFSRPTRSPVSDRTLTTAATAPPAAASRPRAALAGTLIRVLVRVLLPALAFAPGWVSNARAGSPTVLGATESRGAEVSAVLAADPATLPAERQTVVPNGNASTAPADVSAPAQPANPLPPPPLQEPGQGNGQPRATLEAPPEAGNPPPDPLPADGQSPPVSENLLGIYRAALASDPNYGAAHAADEASGEAVPQARSGFLPRADLSADIAYNRLDVNYGGDFIFPDGTYDFRSRGVTVNATQPLYRPENRPRLDQARARVRQSQAELYAARQDLALRVAQAYFEALRAQDDLTLLRAQQAAVAEQLAQARQAFEAGTVPITDANEAQSRFDLIEAQKIAAGNRVEVRREALREIIGYVPLQLQKLDPRVSPAAVAGGPDHWAARTADAWRVVAARAAVAAAGLEVEVARAGRRPSLDLVAGHGARADGGSTFGVDTDTGVTAVGLQLKVPLYQGGQVDSKVREAEARRRQAQQVLEGTRRAAAQAAREAYLGVQSGVAQVAALMQALRSGESQLQSSTLGAEVGVRTSLDVLNARQQVFATRRDLASARYDLVLSSLRLKAAVGALGEGDLAEVSRQLVEP